MVGRLATGDRGGDAPALGSDALLGSARRPGLPLTGRATPAVTRCEELRPGKGPGGPGGADQTSRGGAGRADVGLLRSTEALPDPGPATDLLTERRRTPTETAHSSHDQRHPALALPLGAVCSSNGLRKDSDVLRDSARKG